MSKPYNDNKLGQAPLLVQVYLFVSQFTSTSYGCALLDRRVLASLPLTLDGTLKIDAGECRPTTFLVRCSCSRSPHPPDSYGRHRKLAEVRRLHEEIRSLEEELEVVEGYPHASKACKELVQFTQTCPDPLLSLKQGAQNSGWNRWFQQPDQDGGEAFSCCLCNTKHYIERGLAAMCSSWDLNQFGSVSFDFT
ncbi:hypothetical protein GOP47_0016319 [Adiantum capillus-veneris]|uniref:G protein gamma domain-containing protein n=1 Tax=Adiantum capillus-veneris TaxID=13818 RepID=A0A9D4ZAM5_ADICA|nr:hypothetical protein GOP47_0016319 [Adiantum capillus-veneris]